MKKILALVLALMLVLSTSMVAFAAGEVTGNGGTADGDVTINVTATDENGEEIENAEDVDPEDAIYSLDIDLENYTFTFNLGEYDPATHTYSAGDGWDHEEEQFDVKNHSNTKVGIAANFQSTSSATVTDNAVTSTISNGVFDLASAVNREVSNPDQQTVTVSVAGNPTDAKNWVIDTIRLTVTGK